MSLTELAARLGLAEQLDLLRSCVREDRDLSDALANAGWSYDHLRYRHTRGAQPALLEVASSSVRSPDPLPANSIPAISFFSGAGGLDLGFEWAGFHHLASIEINEIFCETLRRNRSAWTVLGPPMHSGDIRNKDEYSHLLRQKLGISAPFEGVFHGGPPCQSFSIAANQRFCKEQEGFKRVGFSHSDYGSLLLDFIWYIQQFQPRAFLIENVTGLMGLDEGKRVAEAMAMLVASGYEVSGPSVLNAADYGVPQTRTRLFILGSRQGNGIQIPKPSSPGVSCYSVLDCPIEGDGCHVTREHKADSVLRYMELKYGERDHLGRVDRLVPDKPAKTVIAGGLRGGGRSHLHPEIPRTLSARECARLQTFPDDFVFCGPPARQFTQVGNAVPPLLAMKIAASIHRGAFGG